MTLLTLCKSLLPPPLEYTSRVWSHYTKRKIMAIECLATKFILRCDFSITYPERLVKLGLLPLKLKREVIDLWFFFHVYYGQMFLNFHFLIAFCRFMEWPACNHKNTDQLSLFSKKVNEFYIVKFNFNKERFL